MKNLAVLCLSSVLAVLAGCTQTQPQAIDTAAADTQAREADTQAIKDMETMQMQAWEAKDVAKVTSFYADDAAFMITNMSPAMGHDAIMKSAQEFANDPAFSVKWTSDKVDVSGDLGYSQGSYTVTATDPQSKKAMMEKGHYVTVFKKQADGSWKIVSDIGTPDAPAMPAP